MKITTSHYKHPLKDLCKQVFPILAVSLPVLSFPHQVSWVYPTLQTRTWDTGGAPLVAVSTRGRTSNTLA